MASKTCKSRKDKYKNKYQIIVKTAESKNISQIYRI